METPIGPRAPRGRSWAGRNVSLGRPSVLGSSSEEDSSVGSSFQRDSHAYAAHDTIRHGCMEDLDPS